MNLRDCTETLKNDPVPFYETKWWNPMEFLSEVVADVLAHSNLRLVLEVEDVVKDENIRMPSPGKGRTKGVLYLFNGLIYLHKALRLADGFVEDFANDRSSVFNGREDRFCQDLIASRINKPYSAICCRSAQDST